MKHEELLRLKPFLDKKVDEYNTLEFIDSDPISIPHQFSQQQDIEIMGFVAAVLAWGQRKTIINKCRELVGRMDGQPYQFIMHHSEQELAALDGFKHRTFNLIDLHYFVRFFKHYYQQHNSLEQAFIDPNQPNDVFAGLVHFRQQFFSLPNAPHRTKKHVASPAEGSTCKRLNMYLRWMVRHDQAGVDFGLWKQISPANLMCPLDLHVERVTRKLGLLQTKQTNWQAVDELTANLRILDPIDPIRYDFALFGMGVAEKL